MNSYDPSRRSLLITGGLAAGVAMSGIANAEGRTDVDPRVLDGQPVPEPPPERSAGPVKPGRGSMLTGKVAVVTGAARGIGRAIAVEFAANGADVVVIDIAGPVSPASDAKAATPEELSQTVRQIEAYHRRGEAIRADIRDIAALRAIADRVDKQYGKIDIVVANAAIQRWKPLLEMEDSDWRDVIDYNLMGRPIRSAHLRQSSLRASAAGSSCSPRCRVNTVLRTQPATQLRSGEYWAS